MKKEKFMRRFFVSKIFLLAGIVVLALLSFALGKKILEGQEIKREIKATEEEIARLEDKNFELSDLFSYLNTDAFLEQEAREKFNLQKDGESVLVVPKAVGEDGDIKIAANTGFESRNEINPVKWWNYFFSQLEN